MSMITVLFCFIENEMKYFSNVNEAQLRWLRGVSIRWCEAGEFTVPLLSSQKRSHLLGNVLLSALLTPHVTQYDHVWEKNHVGQI